MSDPVWEDGEKDKCEFCHGRRGGVPGNENVLEDGRCICDYCHAEQLLRT